ncbi:hypothetical protein GCM10018790_12230 [Kitasatospora xanthocidica]|nr:hypothetical protein GCM10018790_12230 [Kitasatospora xanthocidica]
MITATLAPHPRPPPAGPAERPGTPGPPGPDPVQSGPPRSYPAPSPVRRDRGGRDRPRWPNEIAGVELAEAKPELHPSFAPRVLADRARRVIVRADTVIERPNGQKHEGAAWRRWACTGTS